TQPGLPLVRDNKEDENRIERPDDDPAVGGRPAGHYRHSQQQEPNVLGDPGAPRDHPALPLGPPARETRRHGATGERTRQLRRPRKQPRLATDIVPVDPSGDSLPPGSARQGDFGGQVQLTALPYGEVQVGLTNEIGSRGLI